MAIWVYGDGRGEGIVHKDLSKVDYLRLHHHGVTVFIKNLPQSPQEKTKLLLQIKDNQKIMFRVEDVDSCIADDGDEIYLKYVIDYEDIDFE